MGEYGRTLREHRLAAGVVFRQAPYERQELLDSLAQPVWGWRSAGQQPLQRVLRVAEVGPGRRRRFEDVWCKQRQEFRPRNQVFRELLDLPRRQAERQHAVDHRYRAGVCGQPFQERPPTLLQAPLRLQLVEHDKGRVDAGLRGEEAEQAQCESVDRRDFSAVQRFERVLDEVSLRAGLLQRLLQAPTHAVAQLRRRLLCERDGDDAVDGPAGEHQREHALDERPSFAGARAGLDEQRLVERLADDGPLALVGGRADQRRLAHDGSCRRATMETRAHDWMPSSARFSANSSSRRREQMRSKSQNVQLS